MIPQECNWVGEPGRYSNIIFEVSKRESEIGTPRARHTRDLLLSSLRCFYERRYSHPWARGLVRILSFTLPQSFSLTPFLFHLHCCIRILVPFVDNAASGPCSLQCAPSKITHFLHHRVFNYQTIKIMTINSKFFISSLVLSSNKNEELFKYLWNLIIK